MQKGIPNVKTAISLRRQLFEQVDKLAREMRVPRSQVFVLALEAYIERHQNRALLDQINRAYEGKPDAGEQKQTLARRRHHRRMVEGEW